MMPPPPANRRRAIGFGMLAAALSLAGMMIAGELTTRLLVPEETFWPMSNIYMPVSDPGIRYTYRPHLNTIAFGVPLETNGLGFRGREWIRSRPMNTRRIVLIGDSYAFGFGVEFEETLGEQLARILERRTGGRHEVLNFGVNGYNSRQELALLENLALGFEPDAVILLPTNNDHDEALAADEEGWLHYDGRADNQRSRMHDSWDAENVSRWMMNSRLLLYLRFRYRLLRQELRDDGVARWLPAGDDWMGVLPEPSVDSHLSETVHRPMERMLQLLDARGVPVLIASAAATTDYRMTLRALAEENNVPMLELMALFPEVGNWYEWAADFGLGWDDHPNAEAYLRFAQGLADTMVELEFEPSRRP